MSWYNSYTGFPYKHLGNNTETGIADKGGFLMFNNVQDEAESYLDIEFGDVPGSGQREIGK